MCVGFVSHAIYISWERIQTDAEQTPGILFFKKIHLAYQAVWPIFLES